MYAKQQELHNQFVASNLFKATEPVCRDSFYDAINYYTNERTYITVLYYQLRDTMRVEMDVRLPIEIIKTVQDIYNRIF